MDEGASLAEVARLRDLLAAHGLQLDLREVTGGNQWNLVVRIRGVPEVQEASIGVNNGRVQREVKRSVISLLEKYREQVENVLDAVKTSD